MTGAVVAVGQGKLSVPQLKELLEARDTLAYPKDMAAPAHGLFLTRVEYKETGEKADTDCISNLLLYHILNLSFINQNMHSVA